MSLDACKRGFLSGCRPVICLDGCHIKTKFGGQILTAVGIDPNDCIYPIAMGVVEVESLATWKWFLQTLKDDLGIDNTYPWTVITDKQKVLIPGLMFVLFSCHITCNFYNCCYIISRASFLQWSKYFLSQSTVFVWGIFGQILEMQVSKETSWRTNCGLVQDQARLSGGIIIWICQFDESTWSGSFWVVGEDAT